MSYPGPPVVSIATPSPGHGHGHGHGASFRPSRLGEVASVIVRLNYHYFSSCIRRPMRRAWRAG
jgi:hypothetical protein